jgi:hypothetical protein
MPAGAYIRKLPPDQKFVLTHHALHKDVIKQGIKAYKSVINMDGDTSRTKERRDAMCR